MANPEHLEILKQGVEVWNQWRVEHDIWEDRSIDNVPDPDPNVPDLSGVDFHHIFSGIFPPGADLSYANLSGANLHDVLIIAVDFQGANLSHANLSGTMNNYAHLRGANLTDADLSNTSLSSADLRGANLNGANLSNADLFGADLSNANLSRANFNHARVGSNTFENVDLSVAKSLETVEHDGPSEISISTIYRSQGNIPGAFLKGVGVDDTLITYIRSLVGKAIEYYSCFISYSSQNETFARRLYADLQNNNVRCWFAPEDMKTGDVIRSRIDEAIRVHDKLLLVLSQHSVASAWVEKEVETAFEKERQQKRHVLFPVRLDNVVMETSTSWAADIRRMRHITDFTGWKDHSSYQKAFARLLGDLKAET